MPLEGLRVVDCTQMLSGPFASQILGDLGAEIIKIERPGVGDITRNIDPRIDGDVTAYFASLNGGKKSVELDCSSPEGAAALERLVESADILLENHKPQTMKRWGLGYNELSAVNPDLLYCSITGFLDGPYEDLPAFDMVVQALSGSMSITGEANGPPVRPGIPIGDICAGMYAVIGLTSALSVSDSCGGQHIRVPMFGGLVSWLTERAGRTFATGSPYPRNGSEHPSLAPYRLVETADGWLAVAVGSERSWERFCAAIEQPELVDDPRFRTNSDRLANRSILGEVIEDALESESAETWFDRFQEYGVPGAPVKDTVEVFEDPHLRQASYTLDKTIGETEMTFVTVPIGFSGLSTGMDRTVPNLGQHTDSVLGEVLSETELQSVTQ
ncbi:CaiB/BaiF CoA transferase family protein [Natronosalvus caseinilyticus]|uniref:CaiB/BaiF CoA transferase family protein n=1 Tax=Natronosalvus caseinilyticus TaxID=2953747 RepID=UPI0028AA3B4F|nr:CaiB/BaiF CoA-transferase family protein [Natronosalvus caseinilyticus]